MPFIICYSGPIVSVQLPTAKASICKLPEVTNSIAAGETLGFATLHNAEFEAQWNESLRIGQRTVSNRPNHGKALFGAHNAPGGCFGGRTRFGNLALSSSRPVSSREMSSRSLILSASPKANSTMQ